MHRAEIDQGRSLLFLNNLTGIPEFASWRFFAVSLLCDLDRQTAHQVVKPVSEKPPHSADRFTSSHVPRAGVSTMTAAESTATAPI